SRFGSDSSVLRVGHRSGHLARRTQVARVASAMPSKTRGAVALTACAAAAGKAFLAPGGAVAPGPARPAAAPAQAAAAAPAAAAESRLPAAGAAGALVAVGLASARRPGRKAPRAQRVRRAAEDEAYGASHTSFYTDAVAKDKYDTLAEVLDKKLKDEKLKGMVNELLDCCVKITDALRVNLVTVNDSSNTFGDTQLTVDVIADDLLWDLAKTSKLVTEASSEEEPEIVKTNPDGQFVLCWDPLDGSSIVDNNWAVGTIVGIWDKSTGLLGATGRDQVMSLVVLYGPRTTAFVTLDDGVYEFTCGPGNEWICSREKIQIQKDCKIFAPANLRAAQEAPPPPGLPISTVSEPFPRSSGSSGYGCLSALEGLGIIRRTTSPWRPRAMLQKLWMRTVSRQCNESWAKSISVATASWARPSAAIPQLRGAVSQMPRAERIRATAYPRDRVPEPRPRGRQPVRICSPFVKGGRLQQVGRLLHEEQVHAPLFGWPRSRRLPAVHQAAGRVHEPHLQGIAREAAAGLRGRAVWQAGGDGGREDLRRRDWQQRSGPQDRGGGPALRARHRFRQ
ncbi:unnamed protein product, partial [Prorocentrum cordatum]